MINTNAPDPLWDLYIFTESEIMYSISIGVWRPDLEVFTSESVYISDYTDFKLYDLIWYWDNPKVIDNPCIFIWPGVYHWVGSELCYWILTDKNTVLSHTKVQNFTIDETKDPNISENFKDYTDTLDGNLSDPKYISTESDF